MTPPAKLRVLLIGAGGLGAPALIDLAARGVRNCTILEPDRLELSNLHRQILYREQDIGEPKAVLAERWLRERLPDAKIDARVAAFSEETRDLIAEHDLVLDGTDRFETKLAIADACLDLGTRFVFAGVVGLEGQALGVIPGRSACPRCLFEEAPAPGVAPSCAEIGILGPVAGIVAANQLSIGLSLFTAAPQIDRLWSYDARRDRARWVPLRRDPSCRGCGSQRSRRGVLAELERSPDEVDAPVLDLQTEVCPNTYNVARRAIERLPDGGLLWVLLDSDEAVRNVPASLAAAGHRVLARKTDGRLHRLLIQRAPEEGAMIEGASR